MHLVADTRPARSWTRTAGWRRSSWSSARGGPSITGLRQPRARCRCSTGRRLLPAGLGVARRGRRPATRSSSRAPTLVDQSSPWVLTVARSGGDRRSARSRRVVGRGVSRIAIPEGESAYERFLRVAQDGCSRRLPGRLRLREPCASPAASACRDLELGGLVPGRRSKREKVLRVVKDAFFPEPVPAPPQPVGAEPDSVSAEPDSSFSSGGRGRSNGSNLVPCRESGSGRVRVRRSFANESSSSTCPCRDRGHPRSGRPPTSRITRDVDVFHDAVVDISAPEREVVVRLRQAACPRCARA